MEIFGTFALAIGAAVLLFHFNSFWFDFNGVCLSSVAIQVGMEYWARWAHKALWHDSLWHMHEVEGQHFKDSKKFGFNYTPLWLSICDPSVSPQTKGWPI